MPGPLPPAGPGTGRGAFGERGFRVGLAPCAIALGLGLGMLLLADGAVAAAGTALLALGVLGLVSVSLGLLAEYVMQRRGGSPPESGR